MYIYVIPGPGPSGNHHQALYTSPGLLHWRLGHSKPPMHVHILYNMCIFYINDVNNSCDQLYIFGYRSTPHMYSLNLPYVASIWTQMYKSGHKNY